MQLEHEFTVPVPVQDAWDVLLDIERVAPCMPGATLESFDRDAGTFRGKVKVKVGPIQVTYGGEARFADRDAAARTVVIEASAKETRGAGTARATIRCSMREEGSSTRVAVDTDLSITGRPAQFGRGVMVEVGNKLLGQFADCLADEIGAPSAAATESARVASAAAAPTAAAASTGAQSGPKTGPESEPSPHSWAEAVDPVGAPHAPRSAEPAQRRTPDAIDLLDAAGAPVLKRVAPVVAAGAAVAVLAWRWRARRS